MKRLILIEVLAGGEVVEHSLQSASFKAQAGATYTLLDQDHSIPDNLIIKRSGDNLDIEIDEEPIAQIEDFYGQDLGAIYSVDGSLTPAEGMAITGTETTTAGPTDEIVWQASEGAESISPWVWAGGLLGAGGIAMAAGGGSSDGSSLADKGSASHDVTVRAVAGPFLATSHALVEFYDDGGNQLGTGKFETNGQVKLSIGDYKGAILVKVIDNNEGAGDYLDEASGLSLSLGAPLRAMGYADGNGDVYISVTPLTELAARQAGITGNEVNEADLAVNDQIAELFAVEDILAPVVTVVDDAYDSSDEINETAEHYGEILAQLSGADKTSGGLTDTLDKLKDAITVQDGSLALSQEGVELLADGVDAFEDGINAGKADLGSSLIQPPLIEAARDGINAAEKDAGVVVKISGVEVGDRITLHWGEEILNILPTDIDDKGMGTVMVPASKIGDAGDGSIAVQYQINDGNKSPAVIIEVDTSAPTITSGDSATAIDENSVADQVIYTATSTDTTDTATGATVYSLKAGSDAGLTIDGSTGEVKLVISPNFEAKPSYSFTVVATDAAGNSSEQTVSLAITDLDEIAPTAPTLGTSNGTELSGVAEAGSSVTVYAADGTTVLGTTMADASSGAYTFSPNPLTDGKTGSVVTTDTAGNVSAVMEITAVDGTAPGAPTLGTSNGTELSGVAEAGSSVTVYAADGTTVLATTTADASSGAYSFSPNPLTDGKTGSVVTTDTAGNVSAVTEITAVDATAPGAPTLGISNGTELSGVAEAGSSVTVYAADGTTVLKTTTADASSGAYTFSPNPLTDGKTGSVVTTDSAGNVSAVTEITAVDATASGAPTLGTSNGTELSGVAEAGSSVTVYAADGTTVLGTTTADATSGAYSFSPNPLTDGKTGSVVTTDSAGNVSAVTEITAVDATAPTAKFGTATDNIGSVTGNLSSGDTTDDTVLALSGSCEAGSTIKVYSGTTELGDATVSGSSWSYSATIADGTTYQLKVKETDAAGNESAATTDFVVAGDTFAPTASIDLALHTVQLEAIDNLRGDDHAPQVSAVGNAGEFVVTWQGQDSGGDTSIFVQKFNVDGKTTGAPAQLEAIGKVGGDDECPQVSAVGSAGEFVVTWYGQDSADDSSIFVQKFNADGTTLGNASVQLEAIGNARGADYFPQVSAVGSAGEFVVTWYGQDSDSANDFSIFVQKFNADGTTLGNAPVQLEAIGKARGADGYPQISAVGSAGDFVVTWQGQDSANDPSIFVQKFNADGRTTGDPVQLEAIGNARGADYFPQVSAVGNAGEFVVTWMGKDSANDFSIFVQKFNADGTTLGNAPVQLEAIGKARGADHYPQISAVGSAGDFVVTWQGSDSEGDFSIFVQKFNAGGTTLNNDPVQLEAIGKVGGTDSNPQISAVGSDGEFVVTWYGQDSANDFSIFVQKFNADGRTTGDPVQLEAIGNPSGADYIPQISTVGSAGDFVVTWQGSDSEGDDSVFVQKFNADGTLNMPPIFTASDSVPVQSSEVGTAYLVSTDVTVTDVASITAAADGQWNQVAITTAGTNTGMATTGLADGIYFVYSADAAGNLSAAAGTTVTIDNTAPTVLITDNTDGTANGPVTYTFTFSEAVTGFTVEDVVVTGGIKGALTGSGTTYNLVVTPDSSSTADIVVNVAADVAQDVAGNNNTIAAESTQSVDTVIPTVAITDNTDGTTTGDVTYTFTFSEAVTGFAATDVVVTGGTKGALTGSGTTYNLVVTPDSSSTTDIVVNVAADVAQDVAGNNNTIAAKSTQSVDTVIPTASIDLVTLPAVQLEAIGKDDGGDYSPQISAVGSDGDFVVTWEGQESAGEDSIFVQKFNADGVTTGVPVQLEAIGNATGDDRCPQVSAVGSAGEFVVTWYGRDSDSPGDNSIFVQKFTANGVITGDPVQLEAIGKKEGSDNAPQVSAVGSDGDFVVTWFGQDSANNMSIFVQKFNADGTTPSPVQLEAIGNTTGTDNNPQVSAIGSEGEFVVTWQGDDSDSPSDKSIFVQKFNNKGAILGDPVQLEAIGNTKGTDSRPQVSAVGSDGDFVVTWDGQDSDSANDNSIFVQKFNADGTTSTPVQLEAIGNSKGTDSRPQVSAVGSDGDFVVTWDGQDSNSPTGYSIFVQKFNVDGVTTGIPVQLEAIDMDGGIDLSPQISAVGSAGEFVVTWSGQDSATDFSIFVQKFNADGVILGDPVQLEAIGKDGGKDNNPQISAVGSAGEFVVTWQGQDSEGDNSIFVQKFNADGTLNMPAIFTASDSVLVQSSEVGTAYLVSTDVTVTDVASITTATDGQWNQVAITTADTNTNMATTGLADGSYSVYSVDAAGNLSAAAGTTVTIDNTAPTLQSSTPTDEATAIALDSNIGLTFTENVSLGSGGTITITDGNDSHVIDVSNPLGQLSITDKVLTINPTGDLANNSATYHVEIGAGAITDTAGNNYAGIADLTILNFDTEAAATPVNTNIVVFDLVHGVSSSHEGGYGAAAREFSDDPSAAYTIYIMVDSDSSVLNTTPTDAAAGATWGQWNNAGALGENDRIVFVGDGAPIQRAVGKVADSVAEYSYAIQLQVDCGIMMRVANDGEVKRYTETHFTMSHGMLPDFDLWGGKVGNMELDGGCKADLYADAIPVGILTSQGLA
ncbi:Ig-like domain-containing protein [Desulfotalea psychrophila]|uniref:Cadherin domain-containing protein n=1 Tax=Desulfotalea psychrophila (strain LSv54 / DSM 12343) TaxID=177439 RepID=Q6ALE1_DESPS|nr:Ig-like domain-containing protein [Desulfotalea psychrophila]CAG36834.1 conserved hypothetical protein [Desulfotalea psychrophila LSv54]